MQPTRRETIRYGWMALPFSRALMQAEGGTYVNDVHSQLNQTCVASIARPRSVEELRTVIRQAVQQGSAVSISGSRHSMGGQQFGTGMVLLDMRGLNRVIRSRFDRPDRRG